MAPRCTEVYGVVWSLWPDGHARLALPRDSAPTLQTPQQRLNEHQTSAVDGKQVARWHASHQEEHSGPPRFFGINRQILQMPEKNGSSGRTRTYNPPVNSRMLCH